MTQVIERRVMRMSTDMIEVIGRPILGSVTLWLRGGGLYHAVLVEGSDGVDVRALYWERNENRFRTIAMTDAELASAEREWTMRSEGRANVSNHNPICACGDCETRRAQGGPAPLTSAQLTLIESQPPDAPPPAETQPSAEAFRRWPIADLELRIAALEERLKRAEVQLAALEVHTAAPTVH